MNENIWKKTIDFTNIKKDYAIVELEDLKSDKGVQLDHDLIVFNEKIYPLSKNGNNRQVNMGVQGALREYFIRLYKVPNEAKYYKAVKGITNKNNVTVDVFPNFLKEAIKIEDVINNNNNNIIKSSDNRELPICQEKDNAAIKNGAAFILLNDVSDILTSYSSEVTNYFSLFTNIKLNIPYFKDDNIFSNVKYVIVECITVGDFVVPESFNQELNQSSTVKHKALRLGNVYDNIYLDDEEDNNFYFPTTTALIDSSSKKISEKLGKATDFKEAKDIAIKLIDFITHKNLENWFTLNKFLTRIATEDRNAITEHILEKEGSLVLSGKILSPTIDDIWEAIKRIIEGSNDFFVPLLEDKDLSIENKKIIKLKDITNIEIKERINFLINQFLKSSNKEHDKPSSGNSKLKVRDNAFSLRELEIAIKVIVEDIETILDNIKNYYAVNAKDMKKESKYLLNQFHIDYLDNVKNKDGVNTNIEAENSSFAKKENTDFIIEYGIKNNEKTVFLAQDCTYQKLGNYSIIPSLKTEY